MTIASLAISAGWMAGRARSLSHRAEPPTTMLKSSTKTRTSRPARDDQERDRHEAQVAVVDPHHHQHRDDAEDGPLDLRPDRRERVVGRRSRASPTTRRPSGCRWRSGPRPRRGSGSPAGGAPAGGPGWATSPASGSRCVGVDRASRLDEAPDRRAGATEARDRRCEVHRASLGRRPRQRGRDRRLERPPAGGVVDEHVEAGGGRAEQHGRRSGRPGPGAASASRASASATADGRRRASPAASVSAGRPPGSGARDRGRSRR